VPGAGEPPTVYSDPRRWPALDAFIEKMMYLDTVTYLPDDILVKVDRASMAVSLEARCPLLDYRVFEFAWRMPLEQKSTLKTGKLPLRRLLAEYLPPALWERPKSGFGVPIETWLRGPLRAWAEDLLSESALKDGGLLAPAPIRRRWQQHLAGQANWDLALWAVLMFQAWRRAG
jgi:asparagine synthase (glutamine-hydrolysing)